MNTLQAIRRAGIREGRQEGIRTGMQAGRQEDIQEGIRTGRQEGITLGVTRAKKAIKAKLLRKGVDPKVIKLVLTEDQ